MTRIAVFGAGAIGCWVGGRLAAGGADVTLIGRDRMVRELAGGLAVSELGDRSWTARPALATEPAAARGADVVLVTVKSGATAEAGRALAGALGDGATVVSLQNGVRNAEVLRAALPGAHVLAGMVPFNVVHPEPGRYHRGTTGTLMFERHDAIAPLAAACRAAELPCELRDDMPAVQWGKLVINLNNAVNALAGIPLAAQLADRTFRRCFALVVHEALDVLAAGRVPVARLLRLPPRWIARLLPMPDWLFRPLAARIASADPHARSSMWDDLEAHRPTEIDYIQGEIVALADKLGRPAPINRTLIALVHAAEAGGKRDFTSAELHAALTRPTA
ncbi:MAG TPA: 2-dehydropantoate 2-reductase [Kofleriaceae bacterium]|nr:2-dehydropantoate 2-reductase [Kofleriaceae bacterium]